MQFGYEAVKQTARASESVDEPEWFEVLQEVFEGLDTLSISRLLIEAWFYLRHAALLGRELSLVNDVSGARLDPTLRYTYDVSEQGLRIAQNGELTSGHIKFLRLVNAKSLKVLAQIGGTETILPDCWAVARQHAAL